MSSKKNYYNDEIDLFETMVIVWNDKWKVFIIAFIFSVVTLFYLFNQEAAKLQFKATTEIKPISTYDEFEYEVYNNLLETIISPVVIISNKKNEEKFSFSAIPEKRKLKTIDKSYLLNLFIDKLSENSFLIKSIKEFELIKKEDYKNTQEYNNAVKKLASSILLLPPTSDDKRISGWTVEFDTYDKEEWETFLSFIEETTNKEVKEYLTGNFQQLILSEKRLKKYKIEDIEIEISNTTEKERVEKLNKAKKMIQDDRSLERIKILFETTPIISLDNFYAAKMIIPSTKYKLISKERNSSTSIIFLAAFVGATLGIFYVLVSNSIRTRINKKSINKFK